MRTNPNHIKYLGLAIALISCIIVDVSWGSVQIPFRDIWRGIFGIGELSLVHQEILYEFRIPRVAAAGITGVALSLAGLLMQGLFRNPVAGPYVLGISSGASLGVAILILGGVAFAWPSWNNSWLQAIFAIGGAMLVLTFIFAAAIKVNDVSALLVVGLMLAGTISAVVTLLQYFSGNAALREFVLWSFGDFGGVLRKELFVLGLMVLVGVILSFFLIKPLNAFLLGERYAKSMGISPKQFKFSSITIAALLAGTVTAFCGPIAFIGIAGPHLARMLFRTLDHRVLMPGVILLGATVMILCDIIAQMPGSDQVLPINAIAAVLGAPVVVWIVLRKRML